MWLSVYLGALGASVWECLVLQMESVSKLVSMLA